MNALTKMLKVERQLYKKKFRITTPAQKVEQKVLSVIKELRNERAIVRIRSFMQLSTKPHPTHVARHRAGKVFGQVGNAVGCR